MLNFNILKCHGSDNDFILLDELSNNNISLSDKDRRLLSQTLCHRGTGIGADGVLFYQTSAVADCSMRMFNPDGGEAEMCGNGLRCIGRYCAEKLAKKAVTVETMKAVLTVQQGPAIYPDIETYEAEIGPLSLACDSLPMNVESEQFLKGQIKELSSDLTFSALTVPNPHIITQVDQIDQQLVERCGQIANASVTFPKGINVSFVKSLGGNKIFVVTYERGVGITFSCGTAMSAAAFIAAINGLVDAKKPVEVFNKGGMVVCDVPTKLDNSNEKIILKGNATFVFEAAIAITPDCKTMVKCDTGAMHSNEIEAYAELKRYAQLTVNNAA